MSTDVEKTDKPHKKRKIGLTINFGSLKRDKYKKKTYHHDSGCHPGKTVNISVHKTMSDIAS